jgi:isoquinoline 1-oxidoreductase beta subunit
MTIQLTRREFIRTSTLAGGGLLLSIWLPGCTTTPQETTTSASPSAATTSTGSTTTEAAPETTAAAAATTLPEPTAVVQPNVYVAIDSNGTVTVTAFRSEMGQGVRTAIAMIIAEELDADWSRVQVTQAPADPAYGNQQTGGSRSIADHYDILRRAGATGRKMLIAAAAALWGVDPDDCTTSSGRVIHPDGQQELGYGDLAEPASAQSTPSITPADLKDPNDFRIIGIATPNVDAPDMITGRAEYACDITLPGMRYAVVARCPVFGGWHTDYDEAAALAVPGVTDVIEIRSGIAVVADNTWAALQGRDALNITWNLGPNANVTSETIRQSLIDQLPPSPQPLTAQYEHPYYAHICMETLGCVARVEGGSCEIWAGTQFPQQAQAAARSIAGTSQENTTTHVPLMGDRFGLGAETHFVEEAVEIAIAVGAPVKTFWTREDDIRDDRYHPMRAHIVGGNPQAPTRPSPTRISASGSVPTASWRSVEDHSDTWARESFVDELAAAAGRDPYELRLEIYPPAARACLQLAAEQADWGSPLPDGWGRGIAYNALFGQTPVAQVAEVSIDNGEIRVHRVVCAVDCGTAVNPDGVRAQMEGGIVFGLTAALKDGITIEAGAVVQSNFHDCRLLRYREMPQIEVHIVSSNDQPTGIGEAGVPPIAPAVANAIFNATGQRLRSLPLRLSTE